MNKNFYEYDQAFGNLYYSSCCSTFLVHNRKIQGYLLSVRKPVCAFIQAIFQKELQLGCRLRRRNYEGAIKTSFVDEDVRKDVIE